jgi:hypothetical protein
MTAESQRLNASSVYNIDAVCDAASSLDAVFPGPERGEAQQGRGKGQVRRRLGRVQTLRPWAGRETVGEQASSGTSGHVGDG